MDYLVSQYVTHYHLERPHQSLGNEPPVILSSVDKPPDQEEPPVTAKHIQCRTRLGGLLKHYYREDA